MTALCYEFAFWPASQYVLKEPSIISSAMDILKAKTPFSIWSGVGEWPGSKKTLWAIVVWDNSDTHKAYIKSPEYPDLIAKLQPSFLNPESPEVKIVHTHFATDPTAKFDAPVTVITFLTPKEGVEREKAESILNHRTKSLAGSDGSNGASWATIEEASEQLLLVEGWTSADDFFNDLRSGNDLTQELQKYFDVDRSIVQLGMEQ